MNQTRKAPWNFTLDEWAGMFWQKAKEQEKNMGLAETWLSMNEFSSKVGEGVRKNEYSEAKKALAQAFRWLCILVNKCTDSEN
jgi:septum formation inhibitor MinC